MSDVNSFTLQKDKEECLELVAATDWECYPEDPDFIVLEDPEGNRFCIVDLSHEHA